MSTLVDFQPTTSGPFQFQATLGGNLYIVFVTWNVFGQRFYINVYDVSGTLILVRAVAGSGPRFAANLSWENGVATAVLNQPHNVPVGSVAQSTVSQTGLGFDGEFQALATDPQTLTYLLPSDPGEDATGQLSFDLNLLDEYGIGTLLYHEDSQQFEYA